MLCVNFMRKMCNNHDFDSKNEITIVTEIKMNFEGGKCKQLASLRFFFHMQSFFVSIKNVLTCGFKFKYCCASMNL